MILERENWRLGYSQILADCQSQNVDDDENENENGNGIGGGGTALILCNADVDGMSAGRILSYMFRNDGIQYELLPCMSYKQLVTIVEQHVHVHNIRAIILLNLGATKNLTKLFDDENEDESESDTQLLDPEQTKIYIMDCRRPIHLANIHAENNVVVFWGNGVQSNNSGNDQLLPSDGDNLSGDEESSTSSSSSDDDDDDDDDSLNNDDDEGETEFGIDEEKDRHDPDDEDLPAPTPDVGQEQDTDYDADADDDDNGPRKRRKDLMDDPAAAADEDEDNMSLTAPEEADTTLPTQASTPDNDSTTNQQQYPSIMTPRELHQDRRNRLRQYYSGGSYYGTPCSFTAFCIAEQSRYKSQQGGGDLLWLACVGVTDAYIHARLDLSGYAAIATELKHSVHRLYPNDEFTRIIAGNNTNVYSEQLLMGMNSSTNTNNLTRIGFSGNGKILAETDFRFFLLRHTSLYDAMYYSDYVSSKFQLLTVKGKHKLHELLAKMGFPLEQCYQPFAFMKPVLRRQLQHKLQEYAEEFGLTNFEYTSFFRITGYQSLLSASDTSYAVTALLECDDASPNKDANEQERLLQSFNIAFDALNSNQTPTTVSLSGLSSGEGSNLSNLVNGGKLVGNTGLGAGIRLTMSLQKNIMATAASLIDRNAVTRLSHFRYAYITCTNQHENGGSGGGMVGGEEENNTLAPLSEDETSHVFAKPLALTRLAHYLMDLHRENGKWTGSKARPLILMAEKPRTKSFLVVGYEYPESAGDLVRNKFGKNFELAAQSMKGTFVFDSFDSNVVEVARPDVQRFIEQLHYLMDSL